MHEYKTARSVCGFVEFCAWAGVVVAVLIVLMAIAASSSRDGTIALVALVPAFSLALASFIVIVMVQMARASMDNSVTSQTMLKESRIQHAETMQALRSYTAKIPVGDSKTQDAKPSLVERVVKSPDKSVEVPTAAAATRTAAKAPTLTEYNGQQIHHEGDRFRVNGINYASMQSAKFQIDKMNARVSSTEPTEPGLASPRDLS